MGALLDTIGKQIVSLGEARADTLRKSAEEVGRIDAAVAQLASAQSKLESDPELEQLYEAIAALNLLPQTQPRSR